MATATPHTRGETTGTADTSLYGGFRHFRERHHVAFEVAFFFAGFVFDYLLLHRIDSTPLLIHQGTYVTLLVLLIMLDHRSAVRGKEPGGTWGKIVGFRQWVIHFFLGTLFNAFMIFYFRSSSGWAARVFISALALALVVNEMPRFRSLGPVLRVALWSLALTSYLGYLLPLLTGHLDKLLFFASVAIGAAATVLVWRLFLWFTKDPNWTFRRAVAPGLAVQALLLVAYFLEAVPPVPLSLKFIGIFHKVTPVHDEGPLHYDLEYVKPGGLSGLLAKDAALEFKLRPGDAAFAFVSIFAPRGFRDQVGFAFDLDDPKKGWTTLGKPFFTALSQSQESGFRTFGKITVPRAGDYRVRILTTDGREIGREDFTVVNDPTPDETRVFAVVQK